MKPPPLMSKEEEPLGVPEEEESPGVEVEEWSGRAPTSPPSHSIKPPPAYVREEEWCGGD
jgi:hypothetical protein